MNIKVKSGLILSAILIAILAISYLTYSTFSTKAQSSTDPSLVGLWHFDEGTGTTAADSSGNNNNGTLVNGPTWTTGKVGGALSFDGVDDYASLGTSGMPSGSQPFSISVWMKKDPALGSGHRRALAFGSHCSLDRLL